jgi:hypothetical protein
MAGNVDEVIVVVVVSQEGLVIPVSLDETTFYLSQGYRIATPAECDKFYKEQRSKSDLRE